MVLGRAPGDGGLGAALAAAGGDGVPQRGEVGVVAVGEGVVEQRMLAVYSIRRNPLAVRMQECQESGQME